MISKALRLIRQYHEMSKLDLAKDLGISKDKLSKIESGTEIVSSDILEKYSKIFDIPMSSLVFFAESIGKQGKYSKKIKSTLAGKVLDVLEWITNKNDSKIKA